MPGTFLLPRSSKKPKMLKKKKRAIHLYPFGCCQQSAEQHKPENFYPPVDNALAVDGGL